MGDLHRVLIFLPLAGAVVACSSSDDSQPPGDEPGAFSFVYCSDRSGNFELYRRTGDVDTQLTNDPLVDSWWPRVSPVDDTVLYYRSDVADRPMGNPGNNNYAFASLWMQDLGSGAEVERIPMGSYGWSTQGVADWSPDARRLSWRPSRPSTEIAGTCS